MHTQVLSERLVSLLREKAFSQAVEELFDSKAHSSEPAFRANAKTQGLANILEREQKFLKAIQTWHRYEVSEALCSKDHFCVRMHLKVTLHDDQMIEMDELIVYEVIKGKIITVQFIYAHP